MIIRRIISGGQSGADIAGLRAARACGIRTGGWAPKGYMTERGPRPFVLGRMYGLQEDSSERYPPRTLKNIMMADATLILADSFDSGSGLTAKMCLQNHKPAMQISMIDLITEYPSKNARGLIEVLQWVSAREPKIINIAGNRESKAPTIEVKAQAFLTLLFNMLLEDIPF